MNPLSNRNIKPAAIYDKKEFLNTGLFIKKKFINQNSLKKLNFELDYYFKEFSINGSIGCQLYDSGTKIFDHIQFIQSINFYELMLDLIDIWKCIYPNFDKEGYILTRASFKEESSGEPIIWHTDKEAKVYRNIIYLCGGTKKSGQFRFMIGSHAILNNIEYAMTKDDYKKYKKLVFDCDSPPGSAIFFDSKGFHSNYAREKKRRILILTWEQKSKVKACSRLLLSSNNLSDRVIKNIGYFSFPEFNFFKIKDYDFNPIIPLKPLATFKYFIRSLKHHHTIAIKFYIRKFLNVFYKKNTKYDGPFLNKKYRAR